MKLSSKGAEFIAGHEGYRTKPYLDPIGIPTIGLGNTYYSDGTKVTMNDPELTRDQVFELFHIVAEDFVKGVNKLVTRELNQNQFDALVSFSYNLGLGNLKSSTLLKKVNSNPCDPTISYEFSRWNKAGGKVLPGLVRRRKEEAELYFS